MDKIILLFLFWSFAMLDVTQLHAEEFSLTAQQASHFVGLALKGIQKEFPNKLDHVMNAMEEVQSPQSLHPAFYGCFDWHSAVHAHWMLVRALRLFPHLPEAERIRSVLSQNLSTENCLREAEYLKQPNRRSFERTYGWAWLLKLAEELYRWEDPQGKEWSKNLQPLTDLIVERYLQFLPKASYPIRTGVHPNTAFGLAFAWDYAHTVGNKALQDLITERSMHYFASDRDYPASWEPGGEDFFSPSLMEADLMRRILEPKEFTAWFHRFLPHLSEEKYPSLLLPALVSDRSDPKIVHLDGLNLSRAWCMKNISQVLPETDPTRSLLQKSSLLHTQASLPHIASGDYVGEHWLASFATYLLTTP